MQFSQGGAKLAEIEVTTALLDLLLVLNDREKLVLQRRFGIHGTKKETLESIGSDLDVTRERVRQIESLALKKLRRTCKTTAFASIHDITVNILTELGGIQPETSLVSRILKNLPKSSETETSAIQLSLAINPEISLVKKSKNSKKSWHLNTIPRRNFKLILDTAIKILKEEKDIIEETNFIKEVQNKLRELKLSVNPKLISSTLHCDNRIKLIKEGYGLTNWRHVEPKSIRDKAKIILRRKETPMHFVEIANEITAADFSRKQVTTQAVHNELIRYDDFVLVGRGLYALKEWGYSEGTVRDVLVDILKANGPMKKQDIIKEVLERRHVKIGTISLNLQKYPEFIRIKRAVYELKSL